MNMPTTASTPERILQRLDWQVIRLWTACCRALPQPLLRIWGDFADLREYQPEDDVRYIDWNVTARMNSPYVRKYVEDRENHGLVPARLKSSMDFGNRAGHEPEAHNDDRFVATMARLLTRHGNRVGAMFYGSRVELTIPARADGTMCCVSSMTCSNSRT